MACEYVGERITSNDISIAPSKLYLDRNRNTCKMTTNSGPLTPIQVYSTSWSNLKQQGLKCDDLPFVSVHCTQLKARCHPLCEA